MARIIATTLLVFAASGAAAPARADTYVCIGTLTDIEVLHRVKQDAYFAHDNAPGKRLRLEYDGCGYRVHVREAVANSRDGDLLLVDREGRVTRVVRQH